MSDDSSFGSGGVSDMATWIADSLQWPGAFWLHPCHPQLLIPDTVKAALSASPSESLMVLRTCVQNNITVLMCAEPDVEVQDLMWKPIQAGSLYTNNPSAHCE